MRTWLRLEYAHDDPLPPGTTGEVRMPDALVERLLEEYSEPGDAVFDPFAGFGTTLAVAERLDRDPYGVEFERDRVEYVEDRIESPAQVRQGDVRDVDLSWVPRCACCVTSPPFMERTDDRNPFQNYAGTGSYETYLDDIETTFARLESRLTAGGHVVVDVANMKYEDRVTTLAWDIADRVSNVFHFEGEIVVAWTDDDGDESDDRVGAFGYGYDHSYCLVFANAQA